MSKVSTSSLAEMKALLPPVPVLATESLKQFEKIFDQVVAALKVQDMVELILVRDFVLASWELARYARHRAVAFDRKLKSILTEQVSHLSDQSARREALARRLAEYLGQRPAEVSHLVKLEDSVMEAYDDVSEILKRTPSELALNLALETSITFHKDLEFLSASMTKRRDQALEMLDRYRQGLGRRAKQAVEEVLDAEYQVVESMPESPAVEDQAVQIAPPMVPTAEPAVEKQDVLDQSVTSGSNDLDPTSVSASAGESGDQNGGTP